MANEQNDLHNKLAGEIVKSIIRPVMDSGGAMADALVLLESVIFGMMLVAVKFDYTDAALDMLLERRVKARMAEQRLKELPTEGHA